MIKKQQAIELFGNRAVHLANALGKTKQAISQWDDTLSRDQTNMVIGAAIRSGIAIPEDLLK